MKIVENHANEGRTISGVLGHEAHIEQVEDRYIVATRRSNSLRRMTKVFANHADAIAHLTNWVATETKES
jgi:hypothetical protein